MNDHYGAESKGVETPLDQIGQNTKKELVQHKISHTQYWRRACRHWWKEAKVIFLWLFLFLGAKQVSHRPGGPGVGAALGQFDISDSNENFWKMFTNVKIRNTKIWGLEEIKMLFLVVQERLLNIYKS